LPWRPSPRGGWPRSSPPFRLPQAAPGGAHVSLLDQDAERARIPARNRAPTGPVMTKKRYSADGRTPSPAFRADPISRDGKCIQGGATGPAGIHSPGRAERALGSPGSGPPRGLRHAPSRSAERFIRSAFLSGRKRQNTGPVPGVVCFQSFEDLLPVMQDHRGGATDNGPYGTMRGSHHPFPCAYSIRNIMCFREVTATGPSLSPLFRLPRPAGPGRPVSTVIFIPSPLPAPVRGAVSHRDAGRTPRTEDSYIANHPIQETHGARESALASMGRA